MKLLSTFQQKYDIDLKKILLNKWFLIILGIKIVVGTFFASDFLTEGFAPFVSYYLASGFANPYEYFVSIGQTSAFPYPPVMLWILTIFRGIAYPFISTDWNVVNFAHLLITRLPILLADIVIYVVLCKWLETKENKVLLYYWASPILFFISYFHGQLDVLPMAVLFISLILLFNKKPLPAMLILGIGLTIKTHLLAVVPFYFVYLLVNKYKWHKALMYSLLPITTFIVLASPYLFSSGFIISVFGTEEAAKIFLVHIPYIDHGLKLLLAPAAVLILFFNFFSYKKLNKDAFLLILGLLFTIFLVFVPPMPGWFYWSIPFFVYFFAKYKETPKFSFWFLNIAYLAYFIFSEDGTFISSLQLVWPQLTMNDTPYILLSQMGVNMPLFVNIIFTLLIAALIMNAVWIYRVGVRSNLAYSVNDKPLTIGIGGDSGSGKNTLAEMLTRVFGEKNTGCIEGDDIHKWERGDEHWKNNTHLDPKSNRLHEDLQQTSRLNSGDAVKRSRYDHDTGKFTRPNNIGANKVMIHVGLHPFYLSEMRNMFDIKIYLDPNEDLRRHWKIMRDKAHRGKTKEEVLQQLEQREPDAQQYIRPQKDFADIIISMQPDGELIDDQKPNLKLQIICDNSLYLDPFMGTLGQISTLQVKHWYVDDLHRQCIEFTGTISVDEINTMGYALMPNLDELTFDSPNWDNNYNGLRQLFIVYYYDQLQKIKNA